MDTRLKRQRADGQQAHLPELRGACSGLQNYQSFIPHASSRADWSARLARNARLPQSLYLTSPTHRATDQQTAEAQEQNARRLRNHPSRDIDIAEGCCVGAAHERTVHQKGSAVKAQRCQIHRQNRIRRIQIEVPDGAIV